MLDFDLACIYEVGTRVLNQAVKRQIRRFPSDFMFQLTEHEWSVMKSQIVTSSQTKRKRSSPPYAFTEQGVAMLSLYLPLNMRNHFLSSIFQEEHVKS